jgi:hypothetical protein
VKGKTKKRILLAAIVAVLAVSGVLFVVWASLMPKTQAFTPHYLAFHGSETKIYFASASSGYSIANQTYRSFFGQQVPNGSQLFTVTLTLRNDYSSDSPPMSNTPVTPIDGTAYICLNTTLHNKQGAVNAVNVTPSDFFVPSDNLVGLVLASGQTSTVNIILATNQTDISDYLVDLVFVSDSIPN